MVDYGWNLLSAFVGSLRGLHDTVNANRTRFYPTEPKLKNIKEFPLPLKSQDKI